MKLLKTIMTAVLSHHIAFVVAQEAKPLPPTIPSNIGITCSFGYGFDRFKTGLLTDDEQKDELTISPGGGVGIGMFINTTLPKNWIIGNEFNYQFTSFIPQAENAEGHFNHLNYQFSLKRAIPIEGEPLAVVVGAGANVSINGKYDFDLRKVQNGAHNIYHYKTTIGPTVQVEYLAWFDRKSLGGIAGIRYAYLKYKLESIRSNGYMVPLENNLHLPSDVERPFSNSLDVYISLIFSL